MRKTRRLINPVCLDVLTDRPQRLNHTRHRYCPEPLVPPPVQLWARTVVIVPRVEASDPWVLFSPFKHSFQLGHHLSFLRIQRARLVPSSTVDWIRGEYPGYQ